MKAADFAYARPDTLAQAVALMSRDGVDAVALAGGQSLMPVMNFRFNEPDLVVDLNAIAELSGISETPAGLRIGALTRHAELMASPVIAEHAPLIALAMPHIAHPAIRNRGTIGGSIALADPAAELPACLLALGGTVHVAGPNGARSIAADNFFLGLYDTALGPAELIVALEVPRPAPGARFAFRELTRRHGDYAMAGLAVAAQVEDGLISSARIAGFGLADRPVRLGQAEAAITGFPPRDAQAVFKAAASMETLDTHGDLNASPQMKRHLAAVLMKRVLSGL
ncbi:xanthine dehydrogenase family protein subunit M [Breoghania sp. L-A4]|uniref:FAD binding domain-containing protein n=1 Tax=Breoghania sp. L-A4 TaxID=2304600 RepID=UPI000E35F7C2|nr:xanthine dehydrogenase family protein subunit M [Breoghania sp. L-A4]AXS41765.1 xanthine dehydrogenase family protein subunit M [Breoghania sp. L-A4]